jgi:hypothetical protein
MMIFRFPYISLFETIALFMKRPVICTDGRLAQCVVAWWEAGREENRKEDMI